MSGSSSLYSFRDGRQVAVQLASRGVLSPGLVQYCSQNTRVHLKYNEILIGDDQRNNDEISETILFPFSFLFTI